MAARGMPRLTQGWTSGEGGLPRGAMATREGGAHPWMDVDLSELPGLGKATPVEARKCVSTLACAAFCYVCSSAGVRLAPRGAMATRQGDQGWTSS